MNLIIIISITFQSFYIYIYIYIMNLSLTEWRLLLDEEKKDRSQFTKEVKDEANTRPRETMISVM